MAGEQLFSKFVIKGGGKTFTEQSTILIFRQKPIRLIVVNAAVIETYTVKKCTNRSRCAHGIYSLTMILKKNAKYRLFDFIQVKAKAGNTGIGIGLCHRKHLIHYGSESPCRIQNNSLNNFAKVICVFRVTHHEIVDGAVLLTRRIAYSYGGFANDQLRRLQMGLLRNRVSPEALKNKFEKRSLERAIAGWGKDDVNLLIDALQHMFEEDMSSSRALTLRKLFVVEHTKPMGNAYRDTIERALAARLKQPNDAPTSYEDYEVTYHREMLPDEVKVTEYNYNSQSV